MKLMALGASVGILSLGVMLSIPQGDGAQPALAPAVDMTVTGSIGSPPRVPSRPEWQEIRNPLEMIALQAPQLSRTPAQYRARRSAGGDREDAISWSSGSPQAPDAEIALIRRQGGRAAPSLYIEMSRRQSERGVAITRSSQPSVIATKFGTMEAADMTFTDARNQSQACLAFRSTAANDISIAGWYCAPPGQTVERPEVSCFVDRLSLLKAGEEQPLRRFFADAEPRRQPCPTQRASTGRKPTWMDSDGRAPAIRGEIAGTPQRN